MSTYISISIPVSNDNPIQLPISATTGLYNATLSYLGRSYTYPVDVQAAYVEMENVFQAGTAHTLKIYDGATLLDDTIYTIITERVASTEVHNLYKIAFDATATISSYSNGIIRGAADVQVYTETGLMYGTTISSPDSDTVNFPFPIEEKQRVEIKIFR